MYKYDHLVVRSDFQLGSVITLEFQGVKLAIPSKFMENLFMETQTAAQLWALGQGRHVVGLLQLSKLYNELRASHFTEDKVGKITDWSKLPTAGAPLLV